MAAAAGAFRQLLLPTIRRRLTTGGTTTAQVHGGAARCVRSYMTEAAAQRERTERLIRESERARLALNLVMGSFWVATFALVSGEARIAMLLYTKDLPKSCVVTLPTEAQQPLRES